MIQQAVCYKLFTVDIRISFCQIERLFHFHFFLKFCACYNIHVDVIIFNWFLLKAQLPSVHQGYRSGVFFANDGYSLGKQVSGNVHILAWAIDCSQQVFKRTFTVGDGLAHDNNIPFPCPYDLTGYLISVQVSASCFIIQNYQLKILIDSSYFNLMPIKGHTIG